MNEKPKKIMRLMTAVVVVVAIVYITNPPKPPKLLHLLSAQKMRDGKKTKYNNITSWSKVDTPYKFAIEVDDFKGDVLGAGTYTIKITDSRTYRDVIPASFAIYVGPDYPNGKDLKEKNKPALIVGGVENVDKVMELTVKKGDYVYIMPQQTKERQSGTITLELL